MTIAEIITEIEIAIQDTSAELNDPIVGYINEALAAISEEASIPELKTLGTVDTVVDQAWANMPTGFNGKLLFVTNDKGRIPVNQAGLEGLLDRDPSLAEVGEVEEVALDGGLLWYRKIPEEVTSLTVVYQKWPDTITADDDVPVYLPPHLQRRLLLHMTAMIIFDKIEDGMDGDKVNTLVHAGMFEKARKEFTAFIGRRRISNMTSKWGV